MADAGTQTQRHAVNGPEDQETGAERGTRVATQAGYGGDAAAGDPTGDIAAALDRLHAAAAAHDEDYAAPAD